MSVSQRPRTAGDRADQAGGAADQADRTAGAAGRTGEAEQAAHRKPVYLDAAELRLREFAPRDVDGVLRVFGDPCTMREFGHGPFERPHAVALVSQAMATARQWPRTHYRLAVSSIRTGELVGSVKLIAEERPGAEVVRTGFRSAEVDCALRADLRGQGLSIEVGRLVTALAFERLGLHRIWTGFLPANLAAQRAADKAGMTCEGILRDYCYADGGWHDLVLYSLLEDDWRPAPAPAPRLIAVS